jgi:hypothetical protein
MMLLYVAWMAIWQAVYDPCLRSAPRVRTDPAGAYDGKPNSRPARNPIAATRHQRAALAAQFPRLDWDRRMTPAQRGAVIALR